MSLSVFGLKFSNLLAESLYYAEGQDLAASELHLSEALVLLGNERLSQGGAEKKATDSAVA